MDQETMKQRWDAMLAKLQQERDELALKMHLGAKDAAYIRRAIAFMA